MTKSEEDSEDQKEPSNWLGDLVKRQNAKGRHWLDGLIKPAPKPERSEPLELPLELKALLNEEPESSPVAEPDSIAPQQELQESMLEEKPQPGSEPQILCDGELEILEEETVALPETYFDPPPDPSEVVVKAPSASRYRSQQTPKPEAKRKVGFRVDGKAVKERLILYRALAIMLESGVYIFAAFQFLSEQATTEQMSESCKRVAQQLASGRSLALVAKNEPALFSTTSAKLLEVGMRSGKLVAVLQRMAEDEQQRWEMGQRLWGKLLYPLCIAALALLAAILLPPLVLSGVLEEVVALTDEPPVITKWLLWFSSTLSSPWTLGIIFVTGLGLVYLVSRPAVQEKLRDQEYILWRIPGLGEIPRTVYCCRFLQLFSLAYDVGIPVDQSLRLASEATGSRVMRAAGLVMDREIKGGCSLMEAIEAADFLSAVALEAVNAGEQVGKVSVMLKKVAKILLTELDCRVDNALKLIEPVFLLTLGIFVGIFAVGCLLPIMKLAETL
jgi:type II secretory pathway component PulF